MTMSATLPPVVCTMSATADSMVPMSPVCLVPLKTPQSTMTWMGSPASPKNVNKKKSPKPTRYMRTRIPTSPDARVHAADPPVLGGMAMDPAADFFLATFAALRFGFAALGFGFAALRAGLRFALVLVATTMLLHGRAQS